MNSYTVAGSSVQTGDIIFHNRNESDVLFTNALRLQCLSLPVSFDGATLKLAAVCQLDVWSPSMDCIVDPIITNK